MATLTSSRDPAHEVTAKIPFARESILLVMAAGSTRDITVPRKSVSKPQAPVAVVFNYTGEVLVRANAAPQFTGSDMLNGEAGELCPLCRSLAGVSTIHLRALADAKVTVSFYY